MLDWNQARFSSAGVGFNSKQLVSFAHTQHSDRTTKIILFHI